MIKFQAKLFEFNFPFKLSGLKSNFTLTLGYLYPALNNPGLVSIEQNKECLRFKLGFQFYERWDPPTYSLYGTFCTHPLARNWGFHQKFCMNDNVFMSNNKQSWPSQIACYSYQRIYNSSPGNYIVGVLFLAAVMPLSFSIQYVS